MLTIVSLVKLDLDNVEEIIPSFSDKIFHFLAYILFTGLWFNTFFYKFRNNKNQSIIRSVIVSALFGIIIEVLQLLITTSRSFDVKDILANLLGILIAAILINNCIKIEVKKY
ncbi:VanZ family protein [Xanthomarina sp. GH4-25]|uniref:VanZ family protein n=1 Tax=Xanthomarina sp. GH4-25 TaxID=3349335 RepID=UPI0038779D32